MIGRMNVGKKGNRSMNTQSNTERRCFRFRTGKGQSLTDEITAIEALATARIRAGVSCHSVQTGARALLKMLLEGVASEMVVLSMKPSRIPACRPGPEPP